MFDIYPSSISSIIESENVYKKHAPLYGDTITERFNDKIYVINGNLSIHNCLVFDLDGNYIDGYSTTMSNEYYKDKPFSEWMNSQLKLY